MSHDEGANQHSTASATQFHQRSDSGARSKNNNMRSKRRHNDDLRAHLRRAALMSDSSDQRMKEVGGDHDQMVMTETLEAVIYSIATSCARVATELLRENAANIAMVALGTNKFGDQQLPLDIAADNMITDILIRTPGVASVASEELPHLRRTPDRATKRWLLRKQQSQFQHSDQWNEEITSAQPASASGRDTNEFYRREPEQHIDISGVQQYCVTFDPLDGSSIVDNNFAVGSIFGVWHGAMGPITKGKRLRDVIAASVVASYGPRTTLFVGLPEHLGGLQEFVLQTAPLYRRHNQTSSAPNRSVSQYRFSWKAVDRKITHQADAHPGPDDGNGQQRAMTPFQVASTAKFFSPGNLRVAESVPAYKKFIQEASAQGLTLRYTGGMVPDVLQILIKGSGIFSYPTPHRGKAKLRTVFECAPIGHMLELAGAVVTDGRPPFYTPRLSQQGRHGLKGSNASAATTGTESRQLDDLSERDGTDENTMQEMHRDKRSRLVPADGAVRWRDSYWFKASGDEQRFVAANLTPAEKIMVAKERPELYNTFLDRYCMRLDEKTAFIVGSRDTVGRLVRLLSAQGEKEYILFSRQRVSSRIQQFDRRIEALQRLVARYDAAAVDMDSTGGVGDDLHEQHQPEAEFGSDENEYDESGATAEEMNAQQADLMEEEGEKQIGRLAALRKINYLQRQKTNWIRRLEELTEEAAAQLKLENIEEGLGGEFVLSSNSLARHRGKPNLIGMVIADQDKDGFELGPSDRHNSTNKGLQRGGYRIEQMNEEKSLNANEEDFEMSHTEKQFEAIRAENHLLASVDHGATASFSKLMHTNGIFFVNHIGTSFSSSSAALKNYMHGAHTTEFGLTMIMMMIAPLTAALVFSIFRGKAKPKARKSGKEA